MFNALELRTQAIVMDGVSQYRDCGDHVIQTTPTEPDFWEGNRIILRDASVQSERAMTLFRDAFPKAAHLCFAFDLPNLDPATLDDGFATLGCKIEVGDTLTLTGPLRDAPIPDGIVLRALDGDDDWAQSQTLMLQWAQDDGYDLRNYAVFHARRTRRNRVLIEQGRGQWFGAFDGGRLIGQLGMFHDDHLARYQDVQTAHSHRRRGVAAALLVHAARWVQNREPDALPVIVADHDAPAGRLYRRKGFDLAETLTFATKPAY